MSQARIQVGNTVFIQFAGRYETYAVKDGLEVFTGYTRASELPPEAEAFFKVHAEWLAAERRATELALLLEMK